MQNNGQMKLALCGCGKLHFTYGAVTVHFDREEFILFAESVNRMSALMRQTSNGSPLSPMPASNIRMCQ